MEIKNLTKTANRIRKAIRKGEKIILYGDSDLDGVASVIILKESIRNLGREVSQIYFPDRDKEGYGISEGALNYLKDFAPALFITLDCGISNFEAVKIAKSSGFEVLIIDHHEVLEKLPKANIIVAPKQKGDKYPFKSLATAGIIFKLSQILLKEKMTDFLRRNFLELVALATLADMMSQEGENLVLINEGLDSLRETFRPGLKVFFEINKDKNNFQQLVQKIISACQAGQNQDHLNETYLLLSAVSIEEAKRLAENLLEKAYQRQMRIREVYQQAEEKILKKISEPIIFEGDTNWEETILGPVASKICRNYQKPVFLFGENDKESRGAVRTPTGINGVSAMAYCAKFLETFGGHPAAAGFRIKNDNLEKFRECLIEYFGKHTN